MKIRKSITVDEAVSREIEKKAAEQNRSFSNLIEKILKDYLEQSTDKLMLSAKAFTDSISKQENL